MSTNMDRTEAERAADTLDALRQRLRSIVGTLQDAEYPQLEYYAPGGVRMTYEEALASPMQVVDAKFPVAEARSTQPAATQPATSSVARDAQPSGTQPDGT